jgi:choloylglycine hydrolase
MSEEESMFRKLVAVVVVGGLALAPATQACTGIQLIAKDGGVVAARTLEFGIDLRSDVLVVPAGARMSGSMPDGSKGIDYTTKYGMAGANGFGLPIIIDGINDQGLYVGLFYFPGYAGYARATAENRARCLAPQEYGSWLLGNFSSVEEVKANFDKVVIVPVVVAQIKQAPPVHFVVHDRAGKTVVIEPIDGRLKIYDDPLGVMANSPTFDWHMTNLSNYINLSVLNVPPVQLSGLKLAQFGQGSGLHGLPGDYTSPSRFVRAAVFSQSAIPSDNTRDEVLQAFHILNAFDIPLGAVRASEDGGMIAEYTTWTSAADLKDLTWSFRTYHDQSIRSVELRAALAAANGRMRTIPMDSHQPVQDVSTSFK